MTIYCTRCGTEANDILGHWIEVHGGVPQARVRDYVFDPPTKRVSDPDSDNVSLAVCPKVAEQGGGIADLCTRVCDNTEAKNTSSWSESVSSFNIRNRAPIRAQLGVLGSSLQAERSPFCGLRTR